MNAVPRIVVGVDGFESSKAALRWAIHQAKLTGAMVDAVTTWHIPPGSGLVPAAGMPDYEDDARIVLTEAITEMCTIDTDVVVRPRVVEGQAGPVLVEAAAGADLLVVGNRGHGGLAEALLGSARSVLRAPRAVPRRHHARQAGRRRLEIFSRSLLADEPGWLEMRSGVSHPRGPAPGPTRSSALVREEGPGMREARSADS